MADFPTISNHELSRAGSTRTKNNQPIVHTTLDGHYVEYRLQPGKARERLACSIGRAEEPFLRVGGNTGYRLSHRLQHNVRVWLLRITRVKHTNAPYVASSSPTM